VDIPVSGLAGSDPDKCLLLKKNC